jgi:Electron transfer DM13
MRTQAVFFSAIAATTISISPFAASVAAQPAADIATMQEASTLSTGTWIKKSVKSSGTWTIYTENSKTFVKLSSDFKTRKAPDLKLFLSPLSAAAANGKNAAHGSVLIASLTSNSGEQIYEIPGSINLADFKSILIHCEQYSKLWSAADLTL